MSRGRKSTEETQATASQARRKSAGRGRIGARPRRSTRLTARRGRAGKVPLKTRIALKGPSRRRSARMGSTRKGRAGRDLVEKNLARMRSARRSVPEIQAGKSLAGMRPIRRDSDDPDDGPSELEYPARSPRRPTSSAMTGRSGFEDVRSSPGRPPIAMLQRSPVKRRPAPQSPKTHPPRSPARTGSTWSGPALGPIEEGEESGEETGETREHPSPGKLVGTAAEMQSVLDRRERQNQARRKSLQRRRTISPVREEEEPEDLE